ncbi:hypothetical protein D3C73_1282190 [compost metagenome]
MPQQVGQFCISANNEHLGAAQGDKFRCFPRSYRIRVETDLLQQQAWCTAPIMLAPLLEAEPPPPGPTGTQ